MLARRTHGVVGYGKLGMYHGVCIMNYGKVGLFAF